jgi:hypothetical protein
LLPYQSALYDLDLHLLRLLLLMLRLLLLGAADLEGGKGARPACKSPDLVVQLCSWLAEV